MRLAASLLALVLPALAWAGPDQDLIAAAKQSDVAAAEKALAAGASPNATDTDGHAVLEKAIFSPELTKVLLSKGADPNGGSYPARVSASNDDAVDTMKLLLDAGADPNRPRVFSDDPGAPIHAMIAAEDDVTYGPSAYAAAIGRADLASKLTNLGL